MKELEDFSWFPSLLRNFQTEFIGFVVTTFNFYGIFIEHLKGMSLSGKPMFDLCSGAGEPAITIFRKCNCFSHLYLSDRYPNLPSINNHNITYLPQSMNVLNIQFEKDAYYTMFNAFHHFSDKEKLMIAERIHTSGSNAFFVEILQPRIDYILKVLLMTTLGSLLLTPFVKPFSISRLFFTYIIPVNILTITYDGLLSVAKSRSVKQYRKLFIHYRESTSVFKLKNSLTSIIVIQIKQ